MISALQLTDTHLRADPKAEVDGTGIDASLGGLIEKSQQTAGNIDLVLLTGDLADDPDVSAYPKIYSRLSGLLAGYFSPDTPVVAVAGNHDLAPPLYAQFDASGESASQGISIGDWHFVLLNSSVAGETGGFLDPGQLEVLSSQLQRHKDQPNVALVMHHPPVAINSQWLDTMKVSNADTLFNLLAGYENVRTCIWGHAHQAFDQTEANIRQLGSPAVYPRQFLPRSREFAIDSARGPGCRLFQLHTNGIIDTQIVRL